MKALMILRGITRAALAHPTVRLAIASAAIGWGVQALSTLADDLRADIDAKTAERDAVAAELAELRAVYVEAYEKMRPNRPAPEQRAPVEMTVQRIDPGGIVGEPEPINLDAPAPGLGTPDNPLTLAYVASIAGSSDRG